MDSLRCPHCREAMACFEHGIQGLDFVAARQPFVRCTYRHERGDEIVHRCARTLGA